MGLTGGTGAVPPPARGTKNPSTGGIFACLRAGRSLRVPSPFCSNKKAPFGGPLLERVMGLTGGTGAVPPPARGTKNPSTGGIFACLRAGRSLRVPSPFCSNKKAPFGGPLLERVMGLEPTISAWKANVLPLHYTRLILYRWCGRRDLNSYARRHWNLNPARLPIPPRPHKLLIELGDPSEIRTPDTLIKSQVLYRLS